MAVVVFAMQAAEAADDITAELNIIAAAVTDSLARLVCYDQLAARTKNMQPPAVVQAPAPVAAPAVAEAPAAPPAPASVAQAPAAPPPPRRMRPGSGSASGSPEAGGAAAVIAGDAIDAHAHQFADIEAFDEYRRSVRRAKACRAPYKNWSTKDAAVRRCRARHGRWSANQVVWRWRNRAARFSRRRFRRWPSRHWRRLRRRTVWNAARASGADRP